MKTIILNSSNIVGGQNNQLVYAFPQGAVTFKNNRIGLSSLSIYYSWPNINSSNGGWSYTWVDGTVVDITLPPGFYDVKAMNAYLQSKMVDNSHYLVDSAGNFVYYLELATNATFYAVQLNSYPVPTALPVGWTKPGAWAFPGVARTPQLTIGSLSPLLGITADIYPLVPQATAYSILSTVAPQITPVSSVLMSCSLINNDLSVPSNLLYSFSPNVGYGSLISVVPSEPVMSAIQDGQYANFQIRFFDQDLNPLTILDPNMVLLLQIS